MISLILRDLLSDAIGQFGNFFFKDTAFFAGRTLKRLLHPARQLLGEKCLHLLPLESEQTIETEIEVGQIKLEEVTKQFLELRQRIHGNSLEAPSHTLIPTLRAPARSLQFCA
jgi:hypothetical protein